MAKFYLHKQTAFILVVCCIAVLGAFFYTYRQSPSAPEQTPSVFARYDGSDQDTSTSTDWKKMFFDTTTSSTSFSTSKSSGSALSEKLTATDQFSRDVFAQFALLHQAGLTNNKTVVSSTLATLLSKDYTSDNQPKTYSLSDVIVNPNNDIPTLKAYGNTLGLLLKAYTPKKDDASIALAGIQGKDPNASQELLSHASDYQTVLKNLLKMSVPKNVVSAHVGLENGASQMIYIATALASTQKDPILAISGLKMYQSAFTTVADNLLLIKATLISAGIHYLDTEGGSYFNIK